MPIIGTEKVLLNLKKADAKLAKDFENGLVKAALALLRESQQLVPVDTGILKASGGIDKQNSGWKTNILVGYTAFYAPFVHEAPMKLAGKPRPGGRGRFWDPQGRAQNKFLEEPARRFASTMKSIVQEEMKIK